MKNNEDIIIHNGAEETVSSEMSKNKIEDDITETENLGSELNSSEYASSPREHTLSDAFGTNSVELATTEDISYPMMKSEASTWDPNFPTFVDPLSNDLSFENCQTNSCENSSISYTNNNENLNNSEEKTSTCITGGKNNYGDLQKATETSQLNGELHIDPGKSGKFVDIFHKDVPNKDSFSGVEALPNSEKDLFPVKLRDNEVMNTKSNCFIDAATLLDDNEVTNFVPSVMSYSCHELDQTKFMSLPFFPTVEKKSNEDHLIQDFGIGASNSAEIGGENVNNQYSNHDEKDLKARRSSLIRRNTFELELDDDRLEILRNEYERHKDKVDKNNSVPDNIICNRVLPQKSPLSDNHVENHKNSYEYIPNIPTDLKFSQKYEEDMHSPDSLNNDETIESSLNKSVEQNSTCYSLPFELNYSNCEYKSDCKFTDITQENQELKETNCCHQVSEEKENPYINPDKSSVEIFSIQSKPNMKTIESAPIVSGGVSLKDLSPPEKQSSSPLAGRRKTELAPIISGGSIIEIEPGKEQKTKLKTNFSESWTIDMTETCKSPSEDNQANDRLLNIEGKGDEQHLSPKSKNSSLGFFVSLDNPYEEKSLGDSGYKSSSCRVSKDGDKLKDESRAKYCSSDSNTSSASCGFYIDLSNAHDCSLNSIEHEENNMQPVSEKKPFSMFVDIGKNSESDDIKSSSSSPHILKKSRQTKISPGSLSFKFNEKQKFIDSQMSSESSLDLTESFEFPKKYNGAKELNSQQTTEIKDNALQVNDKKQGFYMFIEAENSPFFHRKTLPSGLLPASQRHSWNSESQNITPTMNSKDTSKGSRIQSHNVFVNKSLDVMFNVNHGENLQSNIPTSQANSSNTLEFESGSNSLDELVLRNSKRNRLGSTKFNKDSQKGTSKIDVNNSKGSKHDSVAFPKSESTCKRSDSLEKNADSSFISITSNDSSSSDIHNSTFIIYDASNDDNATNNDLDLSTPVCDIPSQFSNDDLNKLDADSEEGQRKTSSDFPATPDHSISQNVVPDKNQDTFSFVKLSDMDKEPAKLHIEEKQVVNRMSRSIPGASWIETKMMTRSATSRSLTRLFPHLNTSAHSLTQEPADYDNDLSEMSSMQSSMDPSAFEGSTEDTEGSSCAGKPVSRLGEDLLRMFLDEISPDVTVEVGGRRIKAHKCILSSRCQYFAAILSGGWVESAGNVISLQGFSYNTVHFALCHIYSGANNIPDSINIVELATLADMLCLEGLKEVIMYTLKVKFCHFFHKPCPMCTVGVLECLPLAAAYGLDEIYRKSLRWITKHFIRVWPTKGFASLPRELLDKCYKQHIIHMSVDNVLETALACTKLQDVIPIVRWAEPVIALTTKLCDSIVKYMAQHFSEVLSPDMLLPLGRQKLWSMSGVEEIMLTAAEKLPPDQACKSYSQLHKLLEYVDSSAAVNNVDINEDFVKFLRKLFTTVEGCLLKQASRASRTPAWTLMEPQLRHKIQDTSCLVIVPGDDRRRARHLLKKGDSPNTNRPTPAKPSASEVPQGKKVTQVKTLNITKQRTGQTASTEVSGPRPKTWPCKLSEVKSRYLEQKPTPKQSPALSNTKPEKTSVAPVGRRNVSKSIISSSDSSRTSSPAMKRPLAQRPSRSLPNKDSYMSRKKESLSVSNDSPTDQSSSGPKQKGEVNNTFKKNQSLTHIDFIDRNMRFLSVKPGNAKRNTRETLSSATVSYSKDKIQPSKMESDKNKHLNLKTSSQNSPLLKDSPLSQTRGSFNSTPPSASKNTPSPKPKSANTSESKAPVLKRTSTYRVYTKSNSSNITNTKPQTIVGSPTMRGNINKLQSKESSSKKCTTNNNIVSNNSSKSETKVQPMVGSRSGTFLKDEPTVLKKPTVMNVSE